MAKNTRGAPKKSPDAGKRHPLSFRTTKEVREQLETAAAASGRSLAQEVEHRLGQSFQNEDLLRTLVPGGSFWLMHLLASTVDFVERKTGKKWLEDAATYKEGCDAISAVLKNLPLAAAGKTLAQDGANLGAIVGRIAAEHFIEKQKGGAK